MAETALVLHQHDESQLFMPAMSVDQAVSRYKDFAHYVGQILKDGTDYGVIPGTQKPTLLKPGAEKLCSFFGLRPQFVEVKSVEQWDVTSDPLFYYWYKCRLEKNGYVVGEGEGSCNSHEIKYRWRWVPEAEIPPSMDKARLQTRSGNVSEFAFAIDKAETSGKYGKPAEYWEKWRKAVADKTARKIERKTSTGKKMEAYEMGEPVYRIPNPDSADQINTIQKMAQKRALIAAVLIAVGASEFFTQDLEDFAEKFAPHPVDVSADDNLPPLREEPPQTRQHRDAEEQPSDTKVFDFKSMVENFQLIHKELIGLGGKKHGDTIYYQTLGNYGCEHANQFTNSKDARQAHRDMQAVRRAWEKTPPKQEPEPFQASDEDLPSDLFAEGGK